MTSDARLDAFLDDSPAVQSGFVERARDRWPRVTAERVQAAAERWSARNPGLTHYGALSWARSLRRDRAGLRRAAS